MIRQCPECETELRSFEVTGHPCDACRPLDPQPQPGPQAAASGSWEEICEVLGENAVQRFSEYGAQYCEDIGGELQSRATAYRQLAARIRAGEVPDE